MEWGDELMHFLFAAGLAAELDGWMGLWRQQDETASFSSIFGQVDVAGVLQLVNDDNEGRVLATYEWIEMHRSCRSSGAPTGSVNLHTWLLRVVMLLN